jgi:hypothetical protein
MDTAVSLKTGFFILASRANYESSREQLLVCPECGEPVHYRQREYPYHTPYFSHYKENGSKPCSLRTVGAHFQNPSQILIGLSQGQLVDRFQREFSFEIFKMLEECADQLRHVISKEIIPECAPSQLVKILQKIKGEIPDNIYTSEIGEDDLVYISDGLYDLSVFLNSTYGNWVLNFLYKTSLFLVSKIHEDLLEDDLGLVRYDDNKSSALFVLDPLRLSRSYTNAQLGKWRLEYVPQIVASLVLLIVSKWRLPEATPDLIMINGEIEGEDIQVVDDSDIKGDDEVKDDPLKNIRFWRSPDLNFVLPPREKWWVHKRSVESSPEPTIDLDLMGESEKRRVMHLIQYGKKIGWPTLGIDKERDLLLWVGRGYTLDDSVFIAKYCYGIDCFDVKNIGARKLKKWLEWAGKYI